jgi:hypothetical protein
MRLRKSLYGLKQASALYHDNVEAWLLENGFKPVGPDGCIFRLTDGDDTVTLCLYVDDGVCSTNSPRLYEKFLKDLG